MASLDRSEYRTIFQSAKQAFSIFQSRDLGMEFQAALVMEMIEGCIGQQSDFPSEAREVLAEHSEDE